MADWQSAWKPAFDEIVRSGASTDRAVAMMLEFGEQGHRATPKYYVSTAITSAGWRRDEALRGPDGIPEAVERNNRTASRILEELVNNPGSLVTASSMMVPTDLGKVPGWKDTDYLIFYFAWLAGLSANGASHFANSFGGSQYTQILERANDRKIVDNSERWPSYQLFTEVAIAKLHLTEAWPDGRSNDGASVLLQLIDVEQSLGCRAERLFADARGLDVVIATFDDTVSGELQSDLSYLRQLGATVGTTRRDVELTPLSLR